MNDTEKIKELREKSGVSVMFCKKALEKCGGDMVKALEALKEESFKMAEEKSERETGAGLVESYIHANKKIGALVEIKAETDFVARNREFQEFAHDIAMQIAALAPENLSGLLQSQFIKDQGKTIDDYLKEMIQKFGENIEIKRFARFEI